MSELKPWDRQPGESRKAFHNFCHYRDLAPHERAMARAYTAHRTGCEPLPNDPQTVPDNHWPATKLWKGWKKAWNWDGRADAHDAHVAEIDRRKRVDAIAAMNERHANIATAVQGKVIARLGSIDASALSAPSLILWLEKATAIERRARGEATEIVKHETPGAPLDLSSLTAEELDEFERLLAKSHRDVEADGEK